MLGRLDVDSLIQWHQYSALVHGWGATELNWQWNPDDRRWDPSGWWHLRSRQFRVATEICRIVPDASPEELRVQTGTSQEQVARLTPDKWVVTRHAPWLRITRSGLMHVCARYAVLRTQSWAHWFAFLRRYGIPAQIASWSDAAQQAQAEDMLKRWGEDVGFVTTPRARSRRAWSMARRPRARPRATRRPASWRPYAASSRRSGPASRPAPARAASGTTTPAQPYSGG